MDTPFTLYKQLVLMLFVWFFNLISQTPLLVYKQYNTFNLPVDHLIDWYLIFI